MENRFVFFDNLDQPVSVFTRDGVYVYVNRAGVQLIGKTPDDLVGRAYLEVFPDLATHPFHAAFQRVASAEIELERLEFFYEPMGLWSSQRLNRADDYVVVSWENITARKETERKLQEALSRAAESERLFRTMIEGMPQLAWTAKADGFIDYYNPGWYAFTGTTPTEMEGWGWQSVHHPEHLPVVMQRWPQSITSGEPFEMQFPLRRHDGTFRWFLTRAAPVRDEAGQVVRWVGINTDIDDQTRALQQLDDTLESMGDAFFMLDHEWRFLRVNRRQEEVSRIARADALGKNFWEVFPAARELKYWPEYHRAMERRTAVHFVEYYAPLDLWTEVDAYPSRDGGIAVFFRDISVRRRAERQLSEERAVLEAVFREAPVGLALMDDQFHYLRLNSVLADINGLPIHGHVGRAVGDVVQGLPPQTLAEWREVLRTGVPVIGTEVVATTPKAPGMERTFRASYFPVRVDEKTIGLGTVFEEITDEKRIATERQRALSALELLAETSTALASSLDYEETLARVARAAVPRFADMCTVYNLTDDDKVQQVAALHIDQEKSDLLRAIHRELDPSRPFGFANVLRTGQTELVAEVTDQYLNLTTQSSSHLELVRKLAPTSWIFVPLKSVGRTTGAIAFGTAGRKRFSQSDVPIAEEIGRRAALAIENARLYRNATVAYSAERRARDKAEEATRLKDEFLATLSHELRTPLNAILGWGRLLQSGSVAEEKRARALDAIVRNAAAQQQLIEDLLDVSRIISGKLRLQVDAVDITAVVAAALDVVGPTAEAKGVRLQSLLDPDAGLISGDAGRLQQVIWNLLTNAVKFTPRGGRVHVSLSRVESHVELRVADTGAGIAPDFLPYVFHRFRQEDGGISRSAGGLGLGLSIVKNLVELHGGTVVALSDGDQKGATFVVKLPIAPVSSAPISTPHRVSAVPQTPAPVACPPEIDNLKVLVVDDEPDARELIRAVLEGCGAVVTTVSSVQAALAAVRSFSPDVIVSDIGMPEEDGYSFIRKVRASSRDAGGRTPAVALTAYARPEDRTRALVEGFQSHAAKPIDPQELLIVVANLAGRYL